MAELLLDKFSSGRFPEGITVMLRGELGAGKTCFVKGAADFLAPDERITSPSYTLINEYNSGPVRFVHADLYRMNSPAEVEFTGLFEYPGPDTILMIEWPDKILAHWKKFISLEINKKQAKTRELNFKARGQEEKGFLEELNSYNDNSGH